MRTRTILLAVLLGTATLAACANAETRSDKPAAKATPSVSKPDKFLAAVKKANIASWTDDARPTDGELLAYPDQWCAGLAEGHSVEYLFDLERDLYPIGTDWGTKEADARKVLVLGVTTYCPEYRDQVTQELRESGDY